jgi:hypothetical protein
MSEESKQNKVNNKAQHNFNTVNNSTQNINQNTQINFNKGNLKKTSIVKQTCFKFNKEKEIYTEKPQDSNLSIETPQFDGAE